jgi:hypothetical protein
MYSVPELESRTIADGWLNVLFVAPGVPKTNACEKIIQLKNVYATFFSYFLDRMSIVTITVHQLKYCHLF